jgi:hypothetical protein
MGFEAFSIVFENNECPDTLEEFFHKRKFAHLRHESDKGRSTRFEYTTDKFIIEAWVTTQEARLQKTRIEFALCNGEGVDKCFERIIEEYLRSFPSEVWFLTSSTKGLSMGHDETANVLAAIQREIPLLRQAWTKAFGDKRGPVRIADAYRFVAVV